MGFACQQKAKKITVITKRETSAGTKTGTRSTYVFALCLVEYERCRTSRASRRFCQRLGRMNEVLRCPLLVKGKGVILLYILQRLLGWGGSAKSFILSRSIDFCFDH